MPIVTIPISDPLDDVGWQFTQCDGYIIDESTVVGTGITSYWLLTGEQFGEWRGWAGRFQNVAVPQGATILSASLEVAFFNETVEDLDTGNNFRVYGDDADDSAPLQSPEVHPGQRTFTTAFTNGPGEPFTGYGTQAWLERRAYAPLDEGVTAIVQEIINRPGWVSGNALSLIMTGQFQDICSRLGSDSFRMASWQNTGGQSGAQGGAVAQLVIEYEEPIAPTIRAAPIII